MLLRAYALQKHPLAKYQTPVPNQRPARDPSLSKIPRASPAGSLRNISTLPVLPLIADDGSNPNTLPAMRLDPHPAPDYADALAALLPPGKAWEWREDGDGIGHAMLLGTAQELARLEADLPGVLQHAIDTHRPRFSGWQLAEYQRIGEDALTASGITEHLPRKTFSIGSTVGARLWSAAAPGNWFSVPLVQCIHLFAPRTVGRHVGDGSGRDPAARLWSWDGRSRYILLVRYFKTVADPKVLWDALSQFKQAHVYLLFEDITGIGGIYAPD
jgi:hypothetical protein